MTYPSPEYSSDDPEKDAIKFDINVETPPWGGAPLTKLHPQGGGLTACHEARRRFTDEHEYPIHRLLDIVEEIVSQRQRGTVARLVVSSDGTTRLYCKDEAYRLAENGEIDNSYFDLST